MGLTEVVEAFDTIARVYDDTRTDLAPATVDRLGEELSRAGGGSILEVGVGTGRIGGPLAARGFRVTGLDASRGMLARAREKGISRLVRGDALRLPFGDRSFDLTFFVHVLHIVGDTPRALSEGRRVARSGVVALVEPADAARPDPFDAPESNPHALVFEELRRRGLSVPPRTGGPRILDRELLRTHPPDRLVLLEDTEVTEPLARQLEPIARRANRWTLRIPPEQLEAAVAEARRRIGGRIVTYRRVRALAFWNPPPGPRG